MATDDDEGDPFEHEDRAVYGGKCSHAIGIHDMHRSTGHRLILGAQLLTTAANRLHVCGWCGGVFAATLMPDDEFPNLRVVDREGDDEG